MTESVRPLSLEAAASVGPAAPPVLRVIETNAKPAVPERYELLEILGEGGMAVVHKARDRATGELVALKRLRTLDGDERASKTRTLFEREFHVLSQLAHPRVVRVHDYGVDAVGPYYTMELLDGGDLHGQAPVTWRRACSLVRDACSVLALLHSRRLIHRDLSPRNLRCTEDGKAKLLDFGAMIPMGPVKQVVGTPPICAPEVLNLELLDARTDLYSLGATLYHALVGRHVYPARDFRHLRTLWMQTPAPPSALAPDVPPALDALVMSMLSLDPEARPANAAEVFERLSVIAELPVDEQLVISSAYLHSPTLVGREPMIARVRKKLVRAREQRGGACLILGAPGVGRSRALGACMLEAKLLGFTVLRTDSIEGQRGDYGGVRALAARLLESVPEAALAAARPRIGLLGHALPELLERIPDAALEIFEDPQARRPRVQRALREWFLEVSVSSPLAIGIDDVDLIDEPTAAFAALLTDGIAQRSLALVCSAQSSSADAMFGAMKVLRDASTRIGLEALGTDDFAELVRSLFGEVPHLQTLAHKLALASQGNPRDAMQLARHMVDRGTIRYASGAWSLPATVDESDLPSSIAQAHSARIASLSDESRQLALALALAPDIGVSFDEAQLLTGHSDAGRLLRCLDELLVAGIIASAARRFSLSQRGFVGLLRESVDAARTAVKQQRLALLFQEREEPFRFAQCLLRAGDSERGLDELVAFARASQELTDADPDAYNKLLQSLPTDWFETFQAGVALCKQLGRPRMQLHTLYSRISGLIPGGLGNTEAVEALVAQLRHDTGLDIYESLDASLEGLPRLGKSFELAQARYVATPENDRVFEPVNALRPLARACIQAIGSVSSRLDLRLWEKLPSLEPFEPLSPALGVVDMLIRGNGKRLTARIDEARAIYGALIERATQPDRAGLDATHQRYMVTGVLCGLGFTEASIGTDRAIEHARAIENDPLHQVNALLITMLYQLWQGDVRAAERCKQQVELLRIQNSARQFFEGGHLMAELTAHALSDDLVRVKQLLDSVALMASNLEGWMPVQHYARGEYHRIRGDHEAALADLALALERVSAGRHPLWGEMAGAHLKVLGALGRNEEARDIGSRYLADAEREGLTHSVIHIKLPLAIAHAALQEREAAEALTTSVIEYLTQIGARGLNLGLAYEARARVARLVGDLATFDAYAARCGEIYGQHGNRTLIAKHHRLTREAQANDRVAADAPNAAAMLLTAHSAATHISAALSACPGPRARARLGLDLLVARSGALGGFLFAIEPRGPVLVAQSGLDEPPTGLTLAVAAHLRTDLDAVDTTDAGNDLSAYEDGAELQANAFARLASAGRALRPTMLGHRGARGYEITGLAVLSVDPSKPFTEPSDVAAHVSRVWFDLGEVGSLTAWLSAFKTG